MEDVVDRRYLGVYTNRALLALGAGRYTMSRASLREKRIIRDEVWAFDPQMAVIHCLASWNIESWYYQLA